MKSFSSSFVGLPCLLFSSWGVTMFLIWMSFFLHILPLSTSSSRKSTSSHNSLKFFVINWAFLAALFSFIALSISNFLSLPPKVLYFRFCCPGRRDLSSANFEGFYGLYFHLYRMSSFCLFFRLPWMV